MLDVGVDGSHEVEANDVQSRSTAEASCVNSAGADVSSGSRKSKAKGPATYSNLLSALTSAFLELGLTTASRLALLELVGAFVFNAFAEFSRLGEDEGEEEHKGDDGLHSYFMIIDY